MTFIKTYGVYFPHYTIADNVLHPKGRANRHSIAYVDEDIMTLAYAAIENLESKISLLRSLDAILFATTTPVFKDRYHASYLAELAGLPHGILALDLGTSNRAGSDALVLADKLIQSGKHENVLVVAVDIRFPPIGKEARTPFGHGAVAMIVSKDKGSVEIANTASYSEAVAEDFVYKGEKIRYDSRFARTAGFKNNMKKVLSGLSSSDTDSLIINSAYVKLILKTLTNTGFNLGNQLATDTLIPEFGFCGAAHGLLRLVYAIENVPGTSALVDYNNGSNVIRVNVKEKPASSLNQDSHQIAIASYQDYLAIRKQGNFEGWGYRRIEMFSSEMMQERDKDQLLYLRGFECKGCGTVYYMKSARCNSCKGTEFIRKQLSKAGKVYALTSEHYFPSSFPPINMIVVDLDGGGRITVQQTNDMHRNDNSIIKIGDKVKLVLRKMMENDRNPNYFWKCVLIDK
jgi:hydroxymethylglutaryl-CoA synthase